MQAYVRVGIRLLYKGWKGRMEGARGEFPVSLRVIPTLNLYAARRLLKSLSIKQGLKYDSPESVRDILPFIEFHNLATNEILKPIDSFSTCRITKYLRLTHLVVIQRPLTSSSTESSSQALAPWNVPMTPIAS
jgi:phosphatidylserine decarboxylase